MTKISKLIAGASALAVLGIAALPIASYAATAEVVLEVTVGQQDSTDGGNNATGYVWVISDKDGGTTNLAQGNSAGGASGGLALIATKVPVTTGITANNSYGFKVTATNGTGVAAGTVVTDGSGLQFYGKDLLAGAGVTASSAVTNATTPVAVSTTAPGTVSVSIPSLTGNATGGANSAFMYDNTLLQGTYQNTLVITTLPKS